MSFNQKIEPASIPYFFRLLHSNAVVLPDLEKAWGIVVSTVPLCSLRSWGWSPGTTGPFCLELGCSVFPHHQKTSYRLKLNIGKDFYRYCFLLFNKQPFVRVQTSRKPAEDRRVFSESDAPDEVHVCGLLFQPSICSQCTYTARVKKCSWNERCKKCEEKIPRTYAILPKHSNMFYLCHSEELGEYMESKGASSPGILTLTTSLSKPFTRLERYPALLKELDRHMQVNKCQ